MASKSNPRRRCFALLAAALAGCGAATELEGPAPPEQSARPWGAPPRQGTPWEPVAQPLGACERTPAGPGLESAERCEVAEDGARSDPECYPGRFCWWGSHPAFDFAQDLLDVGAGAAEALFVADFTGVWRVDDAGRSLLLRSVSLEGWSARRLAQGEDGGLWVSARADDGSALLFERRGARWYRHRFDASAQLDPATLARGPWIGLLAGGALRWTEGAWRRASFDPSNPACAALASDGARALCLSRDAAWLRDAGGAVERRALRSSSAPIDARFGTDGTPWLATASPTADPQRAVRYAVSEWTARGLEERASLSVGRILADGERGLLPRLFPLAQGDLFFELFALQYGGLARRGGAWETVPEDPRRSAGCRLFAPYRGSELRCVGLGYGTWDFARVSLLGGLTEESFGPTVLSNLVVLSAEDVRAVESSFPARVLRWDGAAHRSSPSAAFDTRVFTGLSCDARRCFTANDTLGRYEDERWVTELAPPFDPSNYFAQVAAVDPFGGAARGELQFAVDARGTGVWVREEGAWRVRAPGGALPAEVVWRNERGALWVRQSPTVLLSWTGRAEDVGAFTMPGPVRALGRSSTRELWAYVGDGGTLAHLRDGAVASLESDRVVLSSLPGHTAPLWLYPLPGEALAVTDGLRWFLRRGAGPSALFARATEVYEAGVAPDGTLVAFAAGGGFLRRLPGP